MMDNFAKNKNRGWIEVESESDVIGPNFLKSHVQLVQNAIVCDFLY